MSFLESGYLVVSAVAGPTLGKMGDRTGKKPVLLLAMSMYFLGAVGAAVTPEFSGMIIFRALQGIGGAIFAIALAVVRPVAGKRLSSAIGSIVAGFGLGITAGFAASGVITGELGWRWLFGLEGILIVAAMGVVLLLAPDPTEPTGVDWDLPGAALIGLGIGSLLLALTFGPNFGWTSWSVLFLFAVSLVLVTAWWIREKRVSQPLLDIAVLS